MKNNNKLYFISNRLLNNFCTLFRRATLVALLFLTDNYLCADNFNVRALWVVRDHVTSKKNIDEIIKFAVDNNYNHLFVQIRGRGDAYYSSKLVPRSHLLVNSNFDPLEYIIAEIRGTNIKIHAWLNTYYLWSSPQKPSQGDHILLNHSSWLDTKKPDEMNVTNMLKQMKKDRKINGEGFYLAPTHPEVEAHLQNVLTELLQNYRLDGVHFDYIRYHDLGWGMNPTGLKFFLNYSSGMPGLPEMKIQEKPSFSDFKKLAITQFLKKASLRIKAYQPNCIVSAAVKPNIYNARNTFGQEWDLWLTAGYIDWAVPMNYTNKNQLFDNNLQIISDNIPKKYIEQIIMGIGAYNQNSRSAGQKIYRAGKNNFGGISIFSYTVFKNNPSYASQIIRYLK